MAVKNTADFVKLLRESINYEINECREEIHQAHNSIYNNSMLTDIQILESVLEQLRQSENSKVRSKVTATTDRNANAADFAESLAELIRHRIDKSRDKLQKSVDHMQQDKLILEIDRLDWVLSEINSILNRESNLENMMNQRIF